MQSAALNNFKSKCDQNLLRLGALFHASLKLYVKAHWDLNIWAHTLFTKTEGRMTWKHKKQPFSFLL